MRLAFLALALTLAAPASAQQADPRTNGILTQIIAQRNEAQNAAAVCAADKGLAEAKLAEAQAKIADLEAKLAAKDPAAK